MADSVVGRAAVEIAAVEKTYPNGTHALAPVNLTVAEGEFVTLLGPSGCGKSTLLKMVAGLLPQSSGNIALWGKPVSEAETSGIALPSAAGNALPSAAGIALPSAAGIA